VTGEHQGAISQTSSHGKYMSTLWVGVNTIHDTFVYMSINYKKQKVIKSKKVIISKGISTNLKKNTAVIQNLQTVVVGQNSRQSRSRQ